VKPGIGGCQLTSEIKWWSGCAEASRVHSSYKGTENKAGCGSYLLSLGTLDVMIVLHLSARVTHFNPSNACGNLSAIMPRIWRFPSFWFLRLLSLLILLLIFQWAFCHTREGKEASTIQLWPLLATRRDWRKFATAFHCKGASQPRSWLMHTAARSLTCSSQHGRVFGVAFNFYGTKYSTWIVSWKHAGAGC
jgi:hypothetical protein